MTTPKSGDRAARAARNQALLRQVNERIRALNEAFRLLTPTATWVCECTSLTCIDRIELTLDEYEAIRAHDARFPVVPGHELPGAERVVERTDRYYVVEKIGVGRELAATRSAG